MGNPEVSLIIPVYNVRKFLEKALNSVQNQTFKDFEVILVDDGSTDGSLDILKNYCSKNKNFHLICQKNSGPGVARNSALKVAKGKYIAFMDSDDFLEENFLECLYDEALETDADIVCCNFYTYYPEKDIKFNIPFNSIPGIYSTSQALKKLILDMGTHYFVWNKFYKKEIFDKNNIKFNDMYFEDIAICPRIFYNAKKVSFLNKSLYNYTSRDTSILHSINAQKINDFIRSMGAIRNFFELKNTFKKYGNHLWMYSQKLKIVAYYYVIMLHKKACNFSGIIENINAATQSIDYFLDKKFQIIDNENAVPDLPYIVKQPVDRSRKKFCNKNSSYKKI